MRWSGSRPGSSRGPARAWAQPGPGSSPARRRWRTRAPRRTAPKRSGPEAAAPPWSWSRSAAGWRRPRAVRWSCSSRRRVRRGQPPSTRRRAAPSPAATSLGAEIPPRNGTRGLRGVDLGSACCCQPSVWTFPDSPTQALSDDDAVLGSPSAVQQRKGPHTACTDALAPQSPRRRSPSVQSGAGLAAWSAGRRPDAERRVDPSHSAPAAPLPADPLHRDPDELNIGHDRRQQELSHGPVDRTLTEQIRVPTHQMNAHRRDLRHACGPDARADGRRRPPSPSRAGRAADVWTRAEDLSRTSSGVSSATAPSLRRAPASRPAVRRPPEGLDGERLAYQHDDDARPRPGRTSPNKRRLVEPPPPEAYVSAAPTCSPAPPTQGRNARGCREVD